MNEAEPETMECPDCDARVAVGSVFCPQCGTKLMEDAAADPAAAMAPRERFMAAAAEKQAGADDDQEDELWEGSYAKQAMTGWWLGGGAGTVVAIVVAAVAGFSAALWGWLIVGLLVFWAALVGVYFYRRHSIRYRLTSHRLLYDRGILSRTRERLELIDVDDVTVFQGPVERLVGVGRIVIHSTDVTDGTLTLTGIEKARQVADTIDDARRRERRRRGLHIEAV
ncbi:MAG: PH domain-containing protein [Pseudomonadota bacterium]